LPESTRTPEPARTYGLPEPTLTAVGEFAAVATAVADVAADVARVLTTAAVATVTFTADTAAVLSKMPEAPQVVPLSRSPVLSAPAAPVGPSGSDMLEARLGRPAAHHR
jgi:hypothetical protein